jgi:hypothetical protein
MSNVNTTSLKIATKAQGVQPNGLTLTPNNLNILSTQNVVFTGGTSVGEVNREVYMRLGITTSGTMVVNVSGATFSDTANSGTLVDANGASVVLSKLKLCEVRLVDTTAGPTIGHVNAAASSAIGFIGGHIGAHGNGSGDQPGAFLWCDSTGVVVDSTHQTINIVNESAAAGFIDIHLAGSD